MSILWLIGPLVLCIICKKQEQDGTKKEISNDDKDYLYEIGRKTWNYFRDTLTEENNYLPPDNYQEDRKEKFVDRTSSTNIGLALLCVISSYDMNYENLEYTLILLKKMVDTIERLPKWNGHLYNWYNIKTLEPLFPRYISSVDSGNFVGYVYVLKAFYEEIGNKLKEKIRDYNSKEKVKYEKLLKLIPNWAYGELEEIEISNADFSKLYDYEKNLFSIGYNLEEDRLTPSYYDLLASEARQTSFIAISKKDVPLKHWKYLGKTLTQMNKYSGLISWSGTAFEYLMPNIIMKNNPGSLIDESCEFMLMGQRKYAKKLGIPWGFSETAFYFKDLQGNYQYKAIGIPWIGLKRGLENDIVIASYASAMALTRNSKEVIHNLKELDKIGMNDKYGFYESVDYTPTRMPRGKKEMIVKTYMSHHQALILLSINNFFNNNILQKRFYANPEIEAVGILLEETMPEKRIITKEEKIKPEKVIYEDYENYLQRTYKSTRLPIPVLNVISSGDYTIIMDLKGKGYSKYKNYIINKYSINSEVDEGIFFYIKNIKEKQIWGSSDLSSGIKADKYEVTFAEDSNTIKRENFGISSKMRNTISPEKPVEIRRLELMNNSSEEQTIEIVAFVEPILTELETYSAHPAFQNLFLVYEYLDDENIFIIKRKNRENSKKEIYFAVSFFPKGEVVGELEYEIDKEKFVARGNFGTPKIIENSKPFTRKIQFTINPILALQYIISLKSEQKTALNLVMSVSENKDEAILNLKEYLSEEKVSKVFELSKAKTDTETRYLNLKASQIETYQKMLGYILLSNKIQTKSKYNKEYYEKERLWQYGISGDLPILLVKISNSSEIDVLNEVIKAYEFFKLKNIEIDLVILNQEQKAYDNYTKEAIQNSIFNSNVAYMQNVRGGIFVLDNEEELLDFYSKLTIETKKGPIERQLLDIEEEYLNNIRQTENRNTKEYVENTNSNKSKSDLSNESLLYQNEYGGFLNSGKEYMIVQDRENRIPTVWSNVIANENFGTLTTDSMGGFTFSKNSGLNKTTNWSNDQVLDTPSEIIYMQDLDTGKSWSLGLNPMPDENEYKVIYGYGYSKYEHENNEVKQELTVFAADKESVKISLLELKNKEPKRKKINLIYYIKPVLGENLIKTNRYIDLKFEKNSNMIILKNKTNKEFKETIFMASSERIKSYTGDKDFFFGEGNISNPDCLNKVSLNNENSLGQDSITAIQLEIEIESYQTKKIVLLLGSGKDLIEAQDIAYKYSNIEKVESELLEIKNKWKNLLEKVQVYTPLESFNILMNGWLIYQTMACRMLARSAFYQSGGAFGFRDQLQDTICLKYFDIDLMKEQIIKHSKHQFYDGDVLHWWHEEINRGVRTKFSDDLLWLVYLVEEYINYSGDKSILNIKTKYVKADILEDGVDEKYDIYIESDIEESIFMHCERALKKSLKFGEKNLPLIGSGDWNDAFSRVGNKGKGESVWLGFFLYDILKKWIKIKEEILKENKEEKKIEISEDKGSEKDLLSIDELKDISEKLKKSLNTNGWDGRWYRRAFTDDGRILGSIQNEECKIDGISQSWAVISGAGDNDKKYISMEALENHLVDRESGLIKLLDPPFEKSSIEPGYIKAYLPGTRENGGQYTHASIWAIIAEAMLGFGDKALELFRMISPIEHSKTKEEANKYKVEPYVLAADIYGQGNLKGRGGWTWYTGSSSWMYEAGLHYILGLTIEKGYLSLNPCIPANWKEYKIHYKYGNSIYNIFVKNPNGKNIGVEKLMFNNTIIDEKKIKLIDNGKVNEVEIIM